MTMTMQETGLEFDIADRARKALRRSGIGVGEMADLLEVSRNTVSRWINGETLPRKRDLKLFAHYAEVPLVWLETGYVDLDDPEINLPQRERPASEETGPVVRPEGFEPPAY